MAQQADQTVSADSGGIRSGSCGFFDLCVDSKMISLQVDDKFEKPWISTAPMLHNKEEGICVTYGPVFSNTAPNYMFWYRS